MRRSADDVNVTVTDEAVLDQMDSALEGTSLPGVVRRSMVATYKDGYRFVSYLLRNGNWKLVDQVWQRGLASTSELLHPERWVGTDGSLTRLADLPPLAPSLQGRVVGDGRLEFEETLGEQGLRLLLEEVEVGSRPAELAAYWEMDRLWLVATTKGSRLAWLIRIKRRPGLEALAEAMGRLNASNAAGCRSACGICVGVRTRDRDILVVVGDERVTRSGAAPLGTCSGLSGWADGILAAATLTSGI
jgi:hypothetical protein